MRKSIATVRRSLTIPGAVNHPLIRDDGWQPIRNPKTGISAGPYPWFRCWRRVPAVELQLPQLCRLRTGSIRAKPRTQCSVAVSADGSRWSLFNASPDLRRKVFFSRPAAKATSEDRLSTRVCFRMRSLITSAACFRCAKLNRFGCIARRGFSIGCSRRTLLLGR